MEKEKVEQKKQIEVGGHYENLGIEEGEGNDHTRLREARDSSLVLRSSPSAAARGG